MSKAVFVLLCLSFLLEIWSLYQIPYRVGIRLCHLLCQANGNCNVESYHRDFLLCVTSTVKQPSEVNGNTKSNVCGKQGCPVNFRCLTNRRRHNVCVTTSLKSRGKTVSKGINRVIVTSKPSGGHIHFYAVDVHKTTMRVILTVPAMKINTLKAYGSHFFWCQRDMIGCGHAHFSPFEAAAVKSMRRREKLEDLAVDMDRRLIYGAKRPRLIKIYTLSKWYLGGKTFLVKWNIFMIEVDPDKRYIYASNTINSQIEVHVLGNSSRKFMIDLFIKPTQHIHLAGNIIYASQDHFVECLNLEMPLSEKNIRRYRQKKHFKHIRVAASNGILMIALDRYIKEYRTNGLEWKETHYIKKLKNNIAGDTPIALIHAPASEGGSINLKTVTLKSSGFSLKDKSPVESVLISTVKKCNGVECTTIYSMDVGSGSLETLRVIRGRLLSVDMQNKMMYRCQMQPQAIFLTDFGNKKPFEMTKSTYNCIAITMDWKQNIVFFLKKDVDFMYYFNISPFNSRIRQKRSICVSMQIGTDVTIFTDKLLHNLYIYKHGYKRVTAYSYQGDLLPPKRMNTPARDVVYKSDGQKIYFTRISPAGELRSGMFGPKDKLVHFLRLISPTPVTGFAVTKSFIITAKEGDYEVYGRMSSKSLRKGFLNWTNYRLHSFDDI